MYAEMNGTSAHASTNGYARHAADEEVKRELSDDELYGEDHEEDGQMPGVSDRPVIHEIETDGSCVHEVSSVTRVPSDKSVLLGGRASQRAVRAAEKSDGGGASR